MISPKVEASQFERDGVEGEVDDTWHWWNNFRCTANFEKKLSLALELTADLPDAEDIERWLGEPIKCFSIPTHLFFTKKKGFPVLPKFQAMYVYFNSRYLASMCSPLSFIIFHSFWSDVHFIYLLFQFRR